MTSLFSATILPRKKELLYARNHALVADNNVFIAHASELFARIFMCGDAPDPGAGQRTVASGALARQMRPYVVDTTLDEGFITRIAHACDEIHRTMLYGDDDIKIVLFDTNSGSERSLVTAVAYALYASDTRTTTVADAVEMVALAMKTPDFALPPAYRDALLLHAADTPGCRSMWALVNDYSRYTNSYVPNSPK